MYNNADEIIKNIWLGNYKSAQDYTFIKNNNISVIINCTTDIPFSPLIDIDKYRIPVNDNLKQSEIQKMVTYIKYILPIILLHKRRNNNILIHCYAGIQRSAIIVLSYIYYTNNLNIYDCIKLIKNRRPIAVTPEMNFKLSIEEVFNIVL